MEGGRIGHSAESMAHSGQRTEDFEIGRRNVEGGWGKAGHSVKSIVHSG